MSISIILSCFNCIRILFKLSIDIDAKSAISRRVKTFNILSASVEQNLGAAKVNNAIQQLNNVTRQNAAASEEMATSSEELASRSEQLKEVIQFFNTGSKSNSREKNVVNLTIGKNNQSSEIGNNKNNIELAIAENEQNINTDFENF